MKKLLHLLVITIPFAVFSQPNTEVYLFDLATKNNQIQLTNGQNISNNEGYDNQPSFQYANTILFASTRNGQTDILSYNINNGDKKWLSNTQQGSEYSPTPIPTTKDVSAIRLDTTGLQLLYRYRRGKSKPIHKELKIGYHVWNSRNVLVSFVLGEPQRLVVSNLKKNTHETADTKIGRSLHNIPNLNLVSYISKKNDAWEIRSLNVETYETKKITNTIPNVEDMCWLADGSILMAKGKALYKLHPEKDTEWKIVKLFDKENFDNITRITTNRANTKLALVAELEKTLAPTLENIRWIAGNWKGEAFGGITEENWSEPSGGSMMATFKLIVDGKVNFYEIETISEVNKSLLLRLKHFDGELKGWEIKDETVDFPLIKVTKNKAIFEGMIFESVGPNNMTVYVSVGQKDGSNAIVPFYYTKK
ncbi:Tol-Pal system beta propeller repeat protein TolB [Kordia sp. SMS9]|uniref:DUF6265 family protein n=1 Tax=Kordia sp. SMS9 TaxID=2282170 RepID=UPI000E0DC59C|nr:DUF6265 family protein [Kordia sp. SMS9]AXG70525.1 Tol-Pal system beta propeller repeat protein TolB [Kordia sp. SMS9]